MGQSVLVTVPLSVYPGPLHSYKTMGAMSWSEHPRVGGRKVHLLRPLHAIILFIPSGGVVAFLVRADDW